MHAVGPNLSRPPYSDATVQGQALSASHQAAMALAEAYANVFKEVLSKRAKLKISTLRLLPLSSGMFAGNYAGAMPRMTMMCIVEGIRLLHEADREALKDLRIELCIFSEREHPEYCNAHRVATGTAQDAHGAAGLSGLARQDDRSKSRAAWAACGLLVAAAGLPTARAKGATTKGPPRAGTGRRALADGHPRPDRTSEPTER